MINVKDMLTEGSYKGCMICSGLPKQLDNDLFTLIGLVGGFDSFDVIAFANKANNREKKLLQNMVDKLELRVVKFDRSKIANSPTYKAMVIFIHVIGREGGVNSLNESTGDYIERYISPKMKKLLFKRWDKIGPRKVLTLSCWTSRPPYVVPGLGNFLPMHDFRHHGNSCHM